MGNDFLNEQLKVMRGREHEVKITSIEIGFFIIAHKPTEQSIKFINEELIHKMMGLMTVGYDLNIDTDIINLNEQVSENYQEEETMLWLGGKCCTDDKVLNVEFKTAKKKSEIIEWFKEWGMDINDVHVIEEGVYGDKEIHFETLALCEEIKIGHICKKLAEI